MPALLDEHINAAKTSTALWMSASTSARFVTSVASPMALPPWPRFLNHCVDPVRTPRSKYNFCSSFCENLRGAFPNAAAGSGDYYNFVGYICHFHSPFSLI